VLRLPGPDTLAIVREPVVEPEPVVESKPAAESEQPTQAAPVIRLEPWRPRPLAQPAPEPEVESEEAVLAGASPSRWRRLLERLQPEQPTAIVDGQPPIVGEDTVYIPDRTVAVVIPAHNEAAVIRATLRSVLTAYDARDVYVFSDGSTDGTVGIAREYLPHDNVVDHRPPNLGKSRGLEYTLKHYIYPRGYVYVTICDADTTMEPDFLVETLKVLRKKDVAAAVGQVKSRWYPKNLISVYRTYGYLMWQMLYKRMQSLTNSVTIASGCSTTWKTRVLRQLDFDHSMSTEDFSLTMQVHRRRLGQIKYISSAVVWTQDPFSVQSYSKQMYRWDRAWWESVRKYQVGLHWVRMKGKLPVGLSVLDVSTLLLTFDIFMFIGSVLILPLFIAFPIEINLRVIAIDSRGDAMLLLAWQWGSVIASALVVALLTRRPRIFLYSPSFIFLMYVDIIVSLQALYSTIRSPYRKVKAPTGANATAGTASVWKSPERREVA
jgi:poly-beta-1,6-N-acetyl-D-glucosamine synthase